MKSLSEYPKVSVLIAAYNAEKYITDSLNSILGQTYSDLEILVCDDASDDDTKNILNEYQDKRIQLFSNDTNMGYLQTMNRLFRLATGELITTQDADDISELNRIEFQVRSFTKDTELGLCGSNYRIIDQYGKEIDPHIENDIITEYREIKENIRYRFLFSKARVMFRKEVLEVIGHYRSFFDRIGWEDYDWTSMVVEKFKVINLQDVLYNYRIHISAVGIGNTDRKKYYGDKIVQFLITQRRKTGTDSLNSGNLNELNKKIEEFDKPFKQDQSLVNRIQSHSCINMGRYLNSLKNAFMAIKIKPFLFKNYTNLVYCCYVIIRRKLRI